MKGIVLDDRLLVMTESDTVGTAIDDLEQGDRIERPDESPLVVTEAVPFGHKVALQTFEPGDPIRKYGEIIGRATQPIRSGAWVHTHNVESTRGRGDQAEEQTA